MSYIFVESHLIRERITPLLPDELICIATNGSIYHYLDLKKKVAIHQPLINTIKDIHGSVVFIASDIDMAGELIAYEIVTLLHPTNQVYRVQSPVDTIKDFSPEALMELSSQTIDMGMVNAFFKKRELRSERLKAIRSVMERLK